MNGFDVGLRQAYREVQTFRFIVSRTHIMHLSDAIDPQLQLLFVG